MRPIDADALIEVIKKSMAENPHKEEMQRAMHIHEHKYFLTLLAGIPTIQPVATETNAGDTISRQAAIDALDFEIVHMTAYCDGKNEGNPLAQYNKGLEDGKKAIEALPSVQPEPHEGRFERKRDGVFCSVCHYGWEFITGVPAEVEREYHYCPNCGARMKGVRHESN